MIDRCDPTIATWSESGDNFVVKDVDKFAQVSVKDAAINHRKPDQLSPSQPTPNLLFTCVQRQYCPCISSIRTSLASLGN